MKSPNKLIIDTQNDPLKSPNTLINANQGQDHGATWDIRTRTWITPKDKKDIIKHENDF